MTLALTPLRGLPEVQAGDDLAGLITAAAERSGCGPLRIGDVLAVAHKAVSKAEGRVRDLRTVTPSARARALAGQQGKDPRHVQVVLDESRQLLRAARGVLICETHHGYVCANAGVDASNLPGTDMVLLLPEDPDGSARALRARLHAASGVWVGVILSDSFGRAWRHGQVDIAIGCAGIQPLEDWRGRCDAHGRELHATWIATADELAGAADAARGGKAAGNPVVLIRGAENVLSEADGPGAGALIRPESEDLFR